MEIGVKNVSNHNILNRERFLKETRKNFLLFTPEQWNEILGLTKQNVGQVYNWFDEILRHNPFLAITSDRRICLHIGQDAPQHTIPEDWVRIKAINVAIVDGTNRKPFVNLLTNKPLDNTQLDICRNFCRYTFDRVDEYMEGTLSYIMSEVVREMHAYYYYSDSHSGVIGSIPGPGGIIGFRFLLDGKRRNRFEWITNGEERVVVGQFNPRDNSFIFHDRQV